MEDEDEESEGYIYVHTLTSANALDDRCEHLDHILLNCGAYERLIKLKTHFKGVLHFMAQDKTGTHLFSNMVSMVYHFF
jgi:hypothetical protein